MKCMDIVSLSQGNFFLYKALGMSDENVKMALLLQAMNKYEEALNSNTNVETLMNCSIAFYNFLLIKADEKVFFFFFERQLTFFSFHALFLLSLSFPLFSPHSYLSGVGGAR